MFRAMQFVKPPSTLPSASTPSKNRSNGIAAGPVEGHYKTSGIKGLTNEDLGQYSLGLRRKSGVEGSH